MCPKPLSGIALPSYFRQCLLVELKLKELILYRLGGLRALVRKVPLRRPEKSLIWVTFLELRATTTPSLGVRFKQWLISSIILISNQPTRMLPTIFITSLKGFQTDRSAKNAGRCFISDFFLFFPFTQNAIYRAAKEADPDNFKVTKWVFSRTTLTSSLRPHIEKFHLNLFMKLAKERGWKIQLPGLVSQARSQASVAAAAGLGPVAQFDEKTFHRYLVNFIVSDDQARFQLPRY